MFEYDITENDITMEREEQEKDCPASDGASWFHGILDRKECRTLSREEEIELGRRISMGGADALEVKKVLVEHNLRFAAKCARKYAGRGVAYEDLFQSAVLALCKAAERYDCTKDVKFVAFAEKYVEGELKVAVVLTNRKIRVSRAGIYNRAKVDCAIRYFMDTFGYKPSAEEIAEFTKLPAKQVKSALELPSVLYLDAPLAGEEEISLIDTIADEKAVDPCDAAVRKTERDALSSEMEALTAREREVLELYYEGKLSFREISDLPEFNCGKETVRCLHNKAIEKLHRGLCEFEESEPEEEM